MESHLRFLRILKAVCSYGAIVSGAWALVIALNPIIFQDTPPCKWLGIATINQCLGVALMLHFRGKLRTAMHHLARQALGGEQAEAHHEERKRIAIRLAIVLAAWALMALATIILMKLYP